MFARLLAGLILVGGAAGAASAQAPDPNQDRLKRLLEEKFGSKPSQKGQTRGLSAPKPLSKDDVFVIKPAQPATPPVEAAPRPKGSSLDAAVKVAQIQPTGSSAGRSVNDAEPPTLLAQSSPAEAGEAAAGDAAPPILVKRNSYVIQLKPDITGDQLDDLITKYKLRVTRHVPSLGVLYVETDDEPPGGGATRGVKPRSGQSGDSLSGMLEPKIIKELRNDPAVDAAFVNSTIGPKTVPKPSGAKTQGSGGATYLWDWRDGAGSDGNWGLKVLRMPAVWGVLEGWRKANPDKARTRVSLLDSGFGPNKQIVYKEVWGGTLPKAAPIADCARSHGTHVTGIIGATFGNGTGIDGMVPKAVVEAVPITRELLSDSFNDGITDAAQQHVSFFMDAITDLSDFLDQSALKPGERRVVNISLAYNWSGVSLTTKTKPTDDRVIRDQVRQHAKVVQSLVKRVQDRVLFVAAAGNDSDGLADPVIAEFASPFAYAGVHVAAGYDTAKNIIVVEAIDRQGNRASFSNTGGHVAAPGVDIMSTVASDKTPFAVCSGTSQAAPHVTALAAILFELDPAKTPAEIAAVIKASSTPAPPRMGAPRIDALEAVLKVAPDSIKYLADLNGDGKVDAQDLEIFKTHLIAIEEAKFGGQAIAIDLNNDGKVDEYERCWPTIDLNGSGRASYDPADARPVMGKMRTDLQVMEAAWTDAAVPFQDAYRDSGLEDIINAWQATSLVAAVPEEPIVAPCK